MEKRKAVVIGAGIGGIATSVYLARNGYDVAIYEKNGSPGGRCGQIIRDGHRFDVGATMLMMPGIYRKVFASLGIPLFEKNDISPLPHLYDIYFDNNEIISFSPERETMRAKLESIEPGSFDRAEKYIKNGYEIFDLGINKLIGRNFDNVFQFTSLRNLVLLFKLKTFISNWNYARKFFTNEQLRMAYTFQNIYVGQSPFDSPALFSMVPAAELVEGSFFPEGGMYSIVERLLEAASGLGVKIIYDSPVAGISVSGNKADDLVLENGERIKADIIIANADLPYVYRKLLPDRRKAERLDRMKYSCSAISFHWGLDKHYPQLGHHSVFLSDAFRDGLDRIFKDKTVGDSPSFYVHAPSRTDPSAAPPGQDTFSFIVGTGHVDRNKKQDWEKIKEKTREALIRRLEQAGLEDIGKHIKFEICLTPENWENICNISRGSVFGSLAHNMMQMGYFRPHNRHGKYKNLYFVGGSTHPGNGIPNVLLSAWLTSERILNKKLIDVNDFTDRKLP
ncbi:MAG: phytoene desaturase family protein [Bacteroidales bacterium]|jgi:phytoene desaturase|nr:phytoene desaturase family protein [Bacteroidales bacterium]MCU0408019.1 phytoene desaturase family protein [Bacteroidales bacterium]